MFLAGGAMVVESGAHATITNVAIVDIVNHAVGGTTTNATAASWSEVQSPMISHDLPYSPIDFPSISR